MTDYLAWYIMSRMIETLLKRYPLISDQVDKAELRVILRELESVLENAIDGDVAELGCYKGTTSLFLARILETRNESRKLYLYDSFAGLPLKSAKDNSTVGDQFVAGELHTTKADLVRTFTKNHLPQPTIKKAWFSDLDKTDMPERICFAFFDGDFYESIRDSFRACQNVFSSGATIVIDDYDSEALPGAARATDEWIKQHQTMVKSFRTEQSLGIIKLV